MSNVIEASVFSGRRIIWPVDLIISIRKAMKNIFSAGILALASMTSNIVLASDFASCDVIEIVMVGDQNGHAQLSCTVANVPACATASNFVGFDKSTTTGKQYLALLTYAQAVNGKVEGVVDHTACSSLQGNVALLTQLRVRR